MGVGERAAFLARESAIVWMTLSRLVLTSVFQKRMTRQPNLEKFGVSDCVGFVVRVLAAVELNDEQAKST